MEAKEYYKKLLERQKSFLNIEKYHEMGYIGKGITIVNAEAYPGKDDHGAMTTQVINDYAPRARVINSQLKGSGRDRYLDIDGESIALETAIETYNIKLFTSSKATARDSTTLNYYKELQQKYGVIFFSAAGNDGDEGVTGWLTKDNTAIAVGAVEFQPNGTIDRTFYSAIGEELDFVSFMGRGTGTSAASPALASMIALLLQRYGDFNQSECVEILKSLCIDLGDIGRDNNHGYGLPVLPLTDKLEILEKLRGKNMEFTDVEKDRWSKPAIDYCVERGTLKGFPDGTFKPSEPMTREQYAQAEYNKAKKEGRI